MNSLNAEQVRMLLEVEAGTFKTATTAVVTRNLIDGLVTSLLHGSVELSSRGRLTLKQLRSGEIAGTWTQAAVVYNYSAVWRTDYPYVNWRAVVKRGRSVKAAPGGSFVCRDLSAVPEAVKGLVQTSIRDLVVTMNREGESVAAH